MVAPSFEIVTWRPSKMSLSIPRGPRVVFTTSATAWHALMFEISCGFPCEVSVPSRRIIIPGFIDILYGCSVERSESTVL